MENSEMTPQDDNNGSIVGDIASDLLTGVPVPSQVRKGLLRAVSRLCVATVEVPAAYLEGKADERRAETQARIRLVETTADQIAQQMRIDPEYARRAVSQFGQKILREQVNLDQIARRSAAIIRSEAEEDGGTTASGSETISDDWLNGFDAEARMKSTEEMQVYFSRMLAGEIKRPHSFSIRSLRTLGNLDVRSARLFEKFCSMCSALFLGGQVVEDARIISMGGNAGSNALAEFGIHFGDLNVLNEHGLVISDFNSWKDYSSSVSLRIPNSTEDAVRIPFHHQNRWWVLVPHENYVRKEMLKISGVALTQAGTELMNIVDTPPADNYTQGLIHYFRSLKLTMVETTHQGPHIVRAAERQ